MSCKRIIKNGSVRIQCTINPLGGPWFDEDDYKKPYQDRECRHDKRFDYKGVLTCENCGATYNDTLFQWENKI